MSQKQLAFNFNDVDEKVVQIVKRGPRDHGRKLRDAIRSHNQIGIFKRTVKCEVCDKTESFDEPAEVGWISYKITGSMRRKNGIACSIGCLILDVESRPTGNVISSRTNVLYSIVAIDAVTDDLDEMF